MLEDFDFTRIVEPLELWFTGHARVLPWREEPSAYEVWVSEIMLQQTRVEAVKPYFERFIRALPDVRSLAACPEDQYLKLWEGLGYYNRVRNLNAAAKQIVEEHGGAIPSDYGTLLSLKGIGHYTAGAILSIAFDQPVPAVDGNVLRVLSRLCADDSDIARQSVRTAVERRLSELMLLCADTGREEREEETHSSRKDAIDRQVVLHPRIFSQALMELGAIVCVPNGAPHCADCPLEAVCEARRQNRIAELPVKTKPKGRRVEDKTVFLIREGEKLALHKRADSGLLAGLYELPNHSGHMTKEECFAYLRSLGYTPLRIEPLGEAKHIFSHVEWHMTGYAVLLGENDGEPAELDGDEGCGSNFLFIEREELRDHYAIPNAFAQYMKYFRNRDRDQ